MGANQNLERLFPSYAATRPYGMLWLAIFIVLNFVLLNVVLATVFSACT